jgi:hypothetical protein
MQDRGDARTVHAGDRLAQARPVAGALAADGRPVAGRDLGAQAPLAGRAVGQHERWRLGAGVDGPAKTLLDDRPQGRALLGGQAAGGGEDRIGDVVFLRVTVSTHPSMPLAREACRKASAVG